MPQALSCTCLFCFLAFVLSMNGGNRTQLQLFVSLSVKQLIRHTTNPPTIASAYRQNKRRGNKAASKQHKLKQNDNNTTANREGKKGRNSSGMQKQRPGSGVAHNADTPAAGSLGRISKTTKQKTEQIHTHTHAHAHAHKHTHTHTKTPTRVPLSLLPRTEQIHVHVRPQP